MYLGGGVTPKMQKLNSKLGDERVTCLAQGWERGIWWTLVKKVIIKSVVQQEFHSTRNPLLGLLKSSSAPGVGCQKVALTGFGQALSLWCLPHRKRGSCGSCKLPLSGGYGFAPPPCGRGVQTAHLPAQKSRECSRKKPDHPAGIYFVPDRVR